MYTWQEACQQTGWFQTSRERWDFPYYLTFSLAVHLTRATTRLLSRKKCSPSVLLQRFPASGKGIINKCTTKHTACTSVLWNQSKNKEGRKCKKRQSPIQTRRLETASQRWQKTSQSNDFRNRGPGVSGRGMSRAKILRWERARHVQGSQRTPVQLRYRS